LIPGCGRSGTTHTSRLLGVLGHLRAARPVGEVPSELSRDVDTRGDRSEGPALSWGALPRSDTLVQARELASAYGYGAPLPSGTLEVCASSAPTAGEVRATAA